MKGSEFVFDSANLLYYKFHKISLNRGESNLDSPKWLKNIKATKNRKNYDVFNMLGLLRSIMNKLKVI